MRFFSTNTFHQAGVIFAFLWGRSSFFETPSDEFRACLVPENGELSLQADPQSTLSSIDFGEFSKEVPAWPFPVSEREAFLVPPEARQPLELPKGMTFNDRDLRSPEYWPP